MRRITGLNEGRYALASTKKATMGDLLNAIVGCSAIYADICDGLLSRAGETRVSDCRDIEYADQRIRALVAEVRSRLKIKASIPSKINRRKRSK